MSSLPFSIDDNPFDKELWGSFGTFKTKDSYALNYVLSSIPISRIDLLNTATEAFDVTNINFDELIQRDIAQDRVLKIANEYLEEGQERVIFFPPLLATLTILDGESIKDQYDDTHEIAENGNCVWTWDEDKFQIQLPISENRTDMQVSCDGDYFHVHNFGCKLRFNSSDCKLVVIDGQHRLSALRHLASNREKRDIVKDLNIPVCIVFTPSAVRGSDESITRDLRELFVRINTTARTVSGHFIRLLDDTSLTSRAARDFANELKTSRIEGVSALHLLEWNQRSDKRAHQTERKYSITTISVVADALEQAVFSTHSRFHRILRLSERESDWPKDEMAHGIQNITDDQFSLGEARVVREQSERHLAPALVKLFTTPAVYGELISRLNSALIWLNGEIERGRNGANSFRRILEREFRRADKILDGDDAEGVGLNFEERIDDYKRDEKVEPYFLNVFQQGYIQTWAELLLECTRLHEDNSALSGAFIAALEELVFDPDVQYFAPSRRYTQNTLYRNGRIGFTKGNKEQWSNLIWASFLNIETAVSFTSSLEDIGVDPEEAKRFVEEVCVERAREGFFSIIDFYEQQEMKTLKKSWEDRGLSDEDVDRLNEAYKASLEDPDSDSFDQEVDRIARQSSKVVKERLENILQCEPLSRAKKS